VKNAISADLIWWLIMKWRCWREVDLTQCTNNRQQNPPRLKKSTLKLELTIAEAGQARSMKRFGSHPLSWYAKQLGFTTRSGRKICRRFLFDVAKFQWTIRYILIGVFYLPMGTKSATASMLAPGAGWVELFTELMDSPNGRPFLNFLSDDGL